MVRDEVKESDMVIYCYSCIARETQESAYSWDIKEVRKMEIVADGNSVDYN